MEWGWRLADYINRRTGLMIMCYAVAAIIVLTVTPDTRHADLEKVV